MNIHVNNIGVITLFCACSQLKQEEQMVQNQPEAKEEPKPEKEKVCTLRFNLSDRKSYCLIEE
jgi:hypothetical protein